MNVMDFAAMGYCLSLFAIVGCWVFWPDIESWRKKRKRERRRQKMRSRYSRQSR